MHKARSDGNVDTNLNNCIVMTPGSGHSNDSHVMLDESRNMDSLSMVIAIHKFVLCPIFFQ